VSHPPTLRRARPAAAAGRRTCRHGGRCCHHRAHRPRRHGAGGPWRGGRRRSGITASIATDAWASDREDAALRRKNRSFPVAVWINERSEAWSGQTPRDFRAKWGDFGPTSAGKLQFREEKLDLWVAGSGRIKNCGGGALGVEI